MNNERRKQLSEIIDRLQVIVSDIDSVREMEEDNFDRIPCNLYGSQKAEKIENAISELEYASSYISDAIDSITSAIE